MHNIISIYDNLLTLKNNNTVVDLTHDMLYSGNDTFDDFLYDVELINKADCNICIGIGGPLTLCQSFSNSTIGYISGYNEHSSISDYLVINKNIYRDVSGFIEKINMLSNK